ncbi:MAG: hypothetical protein AAF909_10155, partial [Pseudomonadota bacterium]
GALGQLGDDLRAKGAPPITPVRHEPDADADTDERRAVAGPIGRAIREGFRQGARRLMARPVRQPEIPADTPQGYSARPAAVARLKLSKMPIDCVLWRNNLC